MALCVLLMGVACAQATKKLWLHDHNVHNGLSVGGIMGGPYSLIGYGHWLGAEMAQPHMPYHSYHHYLGHLKSFSKGTWYPLFWW